MQKYLEYSKAFGASEKVEKWITSTLKNYLDKNSPSQDEVEHIIDYFLSDEVPQRIEHMAYAEAKSNTEKWNKALIKKGEHIKETEKDTEIILDFKDGFKIVKLVGKNAYEREGYLMRHCVASYFGNDKTILSLRDKNNNPHCTIEIG